jgi:hypothetical protein
MTIDPKMEQAAIDLWEDLSNQRKSIISVGAGETLIVYVKKGVKKPQVPTTWEGYEVVVKTISVPVVVGAG